MTIRISADFSSFVFVDDEQKSHVVPLDPSRDIGDMDGFTISTDQNSGRALFPAFAADPGFQLIDERLSKSVPLW